jgi:hypothetical protein
VVQVTVEKEAATSSSRFSRGMARTYLSIAYPELITLINFAIAHNCAPALTGIISRLRTRLRTLISSVAKYSLRVSIASKKIVKAHGQVLVRYLMCVISKSLTFAKNLAFWWVLWGPLRILHPLWQGKGAFLKLPRSTSASGNKHNKCYITTL